MLPRRHAPSVLIHYCEEIARSCWNSSPEAREDLARAREAAGCQTVKPSPGPAGTHGIDGFPAADEPARGLEPQENRIQGPGSQPAALLHVRPRQLVRGVLEERLQGPEGLERDPHTTVPLTHGCNST